MASEYSLFNHADHSTIGRKKEQRWDAPVYGFFKPEPLRETVKGCPCLLFVYAAEHCRMPTHFCNRYTDMRVVDRSTGNMCKYVQKCFGDEALAAADKAKNADEVRKTTLTSGGVEALDNRLTPTHTHTQPQPTHKLNHTLV